MTILAFPEPSSTASSGAPPIRVARPRLGLVALALAANLCAGCSDEPDPVPVDEIPPAAPEALLASPEGRQGVSIEWTAPADDDGSAVVGYQLRVATEPFTEADFDTQGTTIATGTPAEPGQAESARFDGARPGVSVYVGIVAMDAAGNRSALASSPAIATSLVQSGSVLAPMPDDDDNALGMQLDAGLLDGDEFSDVVVSAPFKRVAGVQGAGAVYIYRGSADGLVATPDVTLQGTDMGAQFGNGLAILDWNGDGADDVAVGAPFGNGYNGRVYIFENSQLVSGAVLSDTDASVVVSADPVSTWFAFSGIGFTLARARFDADDRDDLIIAAPAADQGVGAFAILYGGTAADGDVVLSELDIAGLGGAVAEVFFAPDAIQGDFTLFGSVLANLGPDAAGTDRVGAALFQGADAYVVRARASRPQDAGVYRLDFDPLVDASITVDPLDEDTYFATPMAAVLDFDGDGVREIALSSYLEGDQAGEVRIIDGTTTGALAASEATMIALVGAPGSRLGSAIASNASRLGSSDVDGDGVEDLIVVGGAGPVEAHVWYGRTGLGETIDVASPDLSLVAPPEFTAATPANGGSPTTIRWIGDVDGDGYHDLAWSDWANNARDGALEVVH